MNGEVSSSPISTMRGRGCSNREIRRHFCSPIPKKIKMKLGEDFWGKYSVGSLHTTEMPPPKKGKSGQQLFLAAPTTAKTHKWHLELFLGGRCLVWKERKAQKTHTQTHFGRIAELSSKVLPLQ